MIKLSLERINAKSPYEVKEAGGGYEFRTEGGILYRFRFLAENPIGGCDTYQFAISKIDNVRSPHDPNISAFGAKDLCFLWQGVLCLPCLI